MLSGVGPKDHLERLGIPVLKDSPVGQKLYDHICYPGLVFKLNDSVSIIEDKAINLQTILEWFQFGTGPLTTIGGVEAIGYIKTPVSNDPEQVPDIELISLGGSFLSDGGPRNSKAIRKGMRMDENIFAQSYGSIDNTNTWSVVLMLLHPKSYGYLELRDTNPFSFPKMYGNYLTHPQDVATFVAGIRHVISLSKTPALQRYGAELHRADFPTCRGYAFDTDEYWECAVRTYTATLHHQIATCKMGPPSDPEAVVDSELRVYGIQGLRVVDTSIIPRTTAAHTNAPAIMIGEIAADLIKKSWNSSAY